MMSDTDYKLVCTHGETEGEEREVYSGDFNAIARYLRLQLEWELACALEVIENDPTQCKNHMKVRAPLHEQLKSARYELLGRDVFENKWQARSTWALVDCE